jgi:hypothetical protein
MPSPAPHDATSGLHDIKAVPTFFVNSHALTYLPWALAVFSLVAVIYALYRRKKKQTEITLSPYQQLLETIKALELRAKNQSIPLAHFASELSLSLRHFIDQTCNFGTVDKTCDEISSELPPLLKVQLDKVSNKRTKSFFEGLLVYLNRCQEVAYGLPQHDSQTDSSLISELTKECKDLAAELAALIDEQRINSITVISEANSR